MKAQGHEHQWSSTGYWTGIGVLLVLGLAIRLIIAPLAAHPGDFAALSDWAVQSDGVGWVDMYRVSETNYPPLSTLMLKTSRTAYLAALPPVEPPATLIDTQGFFNWHVLLKLPAIVADGVIIALVGVLGRRRLLGLGVAASVALHPALIQMSGWWGQYDSVYVALAFAAICAAVGRRPLAAGVLLGLAVMVKLQALMVAPVIYAIFSRENRTGKHLGLLSAGLAAAWLPLSLPFLLTGQMTLVLNRLIAVAAGPGWPTINALNLWYLLTGGAGNWAFNAPMPVSDIDLRIMGLSARPVGVLLLGGWTALITWLGFRARSDSGWLLAAGLLFMGLFLWPTQAHERYALGAVVMLAGAVTLTSTPRWPVIGLYGMISLMHSLNLLWAAPPFESLSTGFAGQTGIGLVIAAPMLIATSAGAWILFRWPTDPSMTDG